jgi:hypothetical protein
MKKQTVAKGLHLLFSATLIAVLAMSIAPAQTARAQVTTSVSDLTISVISIPKHGKACETFEVTYAVTNLGPDPATNVRLGINVPDQLEYPQEVRGEPSYLAVGETATITAVIPVLYVDRDRKGWVDATVYSAPYPNLSIDPNLQNNRISSQFKLIGSNNNCR